MLSERNQTQKLHTDITEKAKTSETENRSVTKFEMVGGSDYNKLRNFGRVTKMFYVLIVVVMVV